ncbi:hypothetical protein [Calycomorphotria hydatis]|uniref:Uncharacterized protein n=1 Tax=Calycomorphotria hydatis TaxID=2528027 RepID=A0A517TBS3_9PLAN|nr:hypothetical protein [Calycomorphotria hydatis]QDT65818.1 hypothetical protein V22_30800 [Calycomorphotria hydatis]
MQTVKVEGIVTAVGTPYTDDRTNEEKVSPTITVASTDSRGSGNLVKLKFVNDDEGRAAFSNAPPIGSSVAVIAEKRVSNYDGKSKETLWIQKVQVQNAPQKAAA